MANYNAVQFVEENMKTIFAYALARVSNKADAEDLASDIILAILQSKDKIKDPTAFYGFVWGIAANTYKSFLRKRQKNSFAELDESIPYNDGVLEELCSKEELNVLRRELSLLSKEYRECTVAYYFDGLSCADTAKKLGISLEMVKYYLFKTRKILKEGIGMEREYGEKSYRPAKFELITIFSGSYNREYRNLFNRKLPGNVLLSAYYTPMTIRELSLELGVATPYLEDEIGLLEKYGFLNNIGAGKYQTNLVVFTEAFTKEFYKAANTGCTRMLESILNGIRSKLDNIRKIGFIGNGIDDNRLLWAFVWMCMRKGYQIFEDAHPEYKERDTIYDGATGTNYGIDYDSFTQEEKYACSAFAGYAGLDGKYAVSFADLGVLPKTNHYNLAGEQYKQMLYDSFEDGAKASFPIFIGEEENSVANIIDSETQEMAKLYEYLAAVAADVMHAHAPKQVSGQIERIVGSTIFFRTVGFIGGCAWDTGLLTVPAENTPAALYGYAINYSPDNCNDIM